VLFRSQGKNNAGLNMMGVILELTRDRLLKKKTSHPSKISTYLPKFSKPSNNIHTNNEQYSDGSYIHRRHTDVKRHNDRYQSKSISSQHHSMQYSHASQNRHDETRYRDGGNLRKHLVSNQRNNQPLCDYCAEPGHLHEQCSHGDYIRCIRCHGWGHKQRNCPTNHNELYNRDSY
jgi:hypothetical protein